MAKTHFVIAFVFILLSCLLFTPSTSLNRDILKHFRQLQQLKDLIDSHRNDGNDEIIIRTGPHTALERPRCSVSPEQTTSAMHVDNLFMERSPLEIIEYSWPRRSFYNNVASSLDAKDSFFNIMFCPETDEAFENNSICVSNGCFPCSQQDIPDHKELTPAETVLCKNEYEKPPKDPEEASSSSEITEQDFIINVSPTQKAPEGKVSGSDVVQWIKRIEEISDSYKKEEFVDCSYSLELAKAMKYVEKLWKDHGRPHYNEDKEKYEGVLEELGKNETHEYYQEKLKYLVGVSSTTYCAPGLICLEEKFCANCSTLREMELELEVPMEVNDTCDFKVETFEKWKEDHPDPTEPPPPPPEFPATYGRMWKMWIEGRSGELELGQGNIIGGRSGQVGSIKNGRDGERVLLMGILLAVGIRAA